MWVGMSEDGQVPGFQPFAAQLLGRTGGKGGNRLAQLDPRADQPPERAAHRDGLARWRHQRERHAALPAQLRLHARAGNGEQFAHPLGLQPHEIGDGGNAQLIQLLHRLAAENCLDFVIERIRRDKLCSWVDPVDYPTCEYQQLVIHIYQEVPDACQILARRDQYLRS